MILNNSNKTLIQSLKGRISKILGGSTRLRREEKKGLENMFFAIDDILLYNGKNPKADGDKLRVDLLTHASVIGDSKVVYIKEHILPLVNKVTTDKWEIK